MKVSFLQFTVAVSQHKVIGDHRRYKSFMAFLMARIIEKCITANLDIVRLVCMACKVSHRSVKLGNSAPDFVVARVTEAVKRVRRLLERKFENIRSIQGRTENWNPRRLNIAADTTMSLPQLLPYIRQILQYANRASAYSSFTPPHTVRLANIRHFQSFTRESLAMAFQIDSRVALADFEFCVEMYLPPWLRGAINDESGILNALHLHRGVRKGSHDYLLFEPRRQVNHDFDPDDPMGRDGPSHSGTMSIAP